MGNASLSQNGGFGFMRKLAQGRSNSYAKAYLFKPEHVCLNFTPTDKWQALDMLLDVLFEHDALPHGEHGTEIRQAIHSREKMMSTGIGQGVAIPHTKTDKIDSHALAIGISPEGIDFDSLDGDLVYITVLLVSSTSAVVSHVQTLANISKRFVNSDVRKEIIQAKTPKQVVMIMTRR